MIGLRKKNGHINAKTGFPGKAWLPFLLMLSLALQGCDAPGTPGKAGIPGKGAANMARTASKSLGAPVAFRPSPANQPPRPEVPGRSGVQPGNSQLLGSLDKVEVAGNPLELATSIIAANTNPFLNRLPKPLVEAVTPEAPPPVFSDPFEGIALLGVIYNSKQPMAFISEGGEPASLKKAGDVLNGGAIRVVQVGQADVTLQTVGVSKEKRTLTLPDIVGYASSKKNPGEPPKQTEKPNVPPPPQRRLRNLEKVSEHPPNPAKEADVTLQEP
jgi:hypothetical protein